jgi:tRNA A-37 threonylcarbamoyl transferase component Bud32
LAVAAKLVRSFRRWGYTKPQAVLELRGEVVSGHGERHVMRVVIGRAPRRMAAYLKREHSIRFRDRLASWWHGHSAVSLSEREAQNIAALRKLNVSTPAVLACGEHQGRAFLLLSAVRGAIDLREFLFRMGAALPDRRRSFVASRLGEDIARVHAAGYDAPDLLCKHVLIHPRRLTLTLIDWARTHRYSQIDIRLAARDLGQLHASLAESLATPRDRLRCLYSYWTARGGRRFCEFRQLVAATDAAACKARRRRSVRDLLQSPTGSARQRLRWIDGELLCVTRPLWRTCRGVVPAWLKSSANSKVQTDRRDVVFSHSRRWILHRWPSAPWWQRWSARILGRRLESPLTRQAGLHFRLKRYGVSVPTVLAFGRRTDGAGFLLTKPLKADLRLTDWLDYHQSRRNHVLRQVGVLLKKLHAAGLRLDQSCDLIVVSNGKRLGLSGVPTSPMPKPAGRWPFVDLRTVVESLRLTHADATRLIRGYLGANATEYDGDKLADALRGGLPSPERVHR